MRHIKQGFITNKTNYMRILLLVACILCMAHTYAQDNGSQPAKITPIIVNKTTFDADAGGMTVIADEIKDYYHITTYFDANDKLKAYYEPVTKNDPYGKSVPVYVSADTYDGDDEKSIVKAEIKDNKTVITYFDKDEKLKIFQSPLAPQRYISTSDCKWSLAGMTVPFKIRPGTDGLPSESKADVDNLGLYFSYDWNYERWYFDDSVNTVKVGMGFFIAPMVEKLTAANAPGLTVESNQVYLSTALAFTLAYNKLTIAIIPLGADTGFSDTAKKWRYNGNFWWGFGIGIDTSLFDL